MRKTKHHVRSTLSLILCTVLIAALALCTMGCNDEKNPAEEPQSSAAIGSGGATTDQGSEIIIKGEGATMFYFQVVDGEGHETKFEIHTDKTTVGDALMELELIQGDMGDYGLYVKTVNGITADYDTTGTYWAFYVNDEYGMTGVDLTEIEVGATYAFKISK